MELPTPGCTRRGAFARSPTPPSAVPCVHPSTIRGVNHAYRHTINTQKQRRAPGRGRRRGDGRYAVDGACPEERDSPPGEFRRDRDRRRPGGARRRLSSGADGPSLRDTRRQRARRRFVAQALGLAPPVHAGETRRSGRHALSRPAELVSHQGPDGGLSRSLCVAFSPARSQRRARREAFQARRPLCRQKRCARTRSRTGGGRNGQLPAAQAPRICG